MTIANPRSAITERFKCDKCGNEDPEKYGITYVQSEAKHESGCGPAWAAKTGFKCHVCGKEEKYS